MELVIIIINGAGNSCNEMEGNSQHKMDQQERMNKINNIKTLSSLLPSLYDSVVVVAVIGLAADLEKWQ